MSYCHIHGRYVGDGCRACRDAEYEILDELARSREDFAAAATHIADAENNPGDYDCPSCMFRTLKKGASRCPKCHADPGRQYWDKVHERERLDAIASAEEWERGRPAREATNAKKLAKSELEKLKANVTSAIIGIGVLCWVYQLYKISKESTDVIGAIAGLVIGGSIMGFVIGFCTWVVVAVAGFFLDAIHSE